MNATSIPVRRRSLFDRLVTLEPTGAQTSEEVINLFEACGSLSLFHSFSFLLLSALFIILHALLCFHPSIPLLLTDNENIPYHPFHSHTTFCRSPTPPQCFIHPCSKVSTNSHILPRLCFHRRSGALCLWRQQRLGNSNLNQTGIHDRSLSAMEHKRTSFQETCGWTRGTVSDIYSA